MAMAAAEARATDAMAVHGLLHSMPRLRAEAAVVVAARVSVKAGATEEMTAPDANVSMFTSSMMASTMAPPSILMAASTPMAAKMPTADSVSMTWGSSLHGT